MSGPRRLVSGIFRAYKTYVSPAIPPACRFQPTCSEYAAEAVQIHGVRRGSVLALRRILRCAPWSAGGFDPVPSPDPRVEVR